MTSNAGHVFISHGSENRDEAEEISGFLEGRGIRTWIAPRDVRPGMDYSEQLQSAIEECLAFVVLVTDTANTSPYVRAETEMAFSNNKPIFPVRRSDIKPAAGLAFFLKIRHWTDAFGSNAEANMGRLARELRALSGLPDEAPPGPGPQASAPPPRPPSPSPPAGETRPPRTDSPPLPDEERLRAAIGPNADYYLGRWRAMDEKSNVLSWNWPACLANFFWFAYRKMWLPMGAMVFAVLLLGVVGAASPELGMVTLIVSILLTFVTGAVGNYLYRRQIVPLAADPALGPAELAARGGVSKTALIASAATAFVLTALLVVALAAQELERQKQLPQPLPPVDPAANAMDGDKPADAAVQADGANPAGIDAGLVVGRWTDTGDCANAVEYTADGRIVAPDGSTGLWQLNGDQLTMTGPNGSRTVQITSIDQSAAYAVNPDGSVETSQRC